MTADATGIGDSGRSTRTSVGVCVTSLAMIACVFGPVCGGSPASIS